MTPADLDELSRRVNSLVAYVERLHDVAAGAVNNVIALTNAVVPVMLVCPDMKVLERFKADLQRITAETDKLLAEAEARELQ